MSLQAAVLSSLKSGAITSLTGGIHSIHTVDDLKNHFQHSLHPYWFIHQSPVHSLGLQNVIPSLRFLSPTDWFNGALPQLFSPVLNDSESHQFSIDFLKRKDVADIIKKNGANGSAAYLFFDEAVEEATQALGLDICFPSAELRRQFDDKCVGNRLAEEVSVLPVPYITIPVQDFKSLREQADKAGLGQDLVIQTPHGDSGQTTFFISSIEEYQPYAHSIESAKEVRIMKRLLCRSIAVEGCITHAGVIVGAPMNDLVGCPELTPTPGGWCGNEVAPYLFSDALTQQMRAGTIRLGEALHRRGYWGCFEVDWLLEEGSNNVYFGEINPRFSGATALSNLTADAIGAPLFLFHLAEFEQLPLDIDFDALNKQAIDPDKLESWSSLIIKHLDTPPVYISDAPEAGVWQLENGKAVLQQKTPDIKQVTGDNQAFWIPEIRKNDQSKKTDIWGRLMLRGRITDQNGQLTSRAKNWINAIRALHILKDVYVA
ncbi:MAG: hypothetical protein V4525_14695 [Pseudomonadota bacterium]